jgi:4-diphosphocytidyl-2-C-methyl-D-erythritol kinase
MAAGALGAVVSGSGPTCAFLAESADHATRLGAAVEASFRSVRTAFGPVPGASVVTR